MEILSGLFWTMDGENMTPTGVPKRGRDDRTPTPGEEQRGAIAIKRNRRESGSSIPVRINRMEPPITMEALDDVPERKKLEITVRLPGEYTMQKEQVAAMNTAPPWAKVILSVIREDIKELGRVSTHVVDRLNYDDDRIIALEKENKQLRTDVDHHQIEMDSMSLRLAKLEVANKKVVERVIRHEVHARKPNLIFCGIPEDGRDTWDECRHKVNNVIASMRLGINPREIKMDKIHRLGPQPYIPKGRFRDRDMQGIRPRPIIATFSWQVDRDRIWRAKGNLKTTGVHLEEDQPKEVEARRYRLMPVYNKALTLPAYKKRTFINGDRLTINGIHYTVDDFDKLPKDLDPRLIATKTDENVTIFFSINSPLSNHHLASMIVDKVTYSCNEQFYFAKRAEVMGDEVIQDRVMREDNPREMLKHGRKAKQTTDVDLEREEI